MMKFFWLILFKCRKLKLHLVKSIWILFKKWTHLTQLRGTDFVEKTTFFGTPNVHMPRFLIWNLTSNALIKSINTIFYHWRRSDYGASKKHFYGVLGEFNYQNIKIKYENMVHNNYRSRNNQFLENNSDCHMMHRHIVIHEKV
jgi:hypothetical protein